MTRPRVPVLLAAGALALGLGACGGDDEEPTPAPEAAAQSGAAQRLPDTLRVYASLGLADGASPDAVAIANGAQLALEEAGGRAGGRVVELLTLDSRGESDAIEPSLVLQNARTAVRDRSTIAYLGEETSGATQRSLPLLNEAGILQVGVTTTYAGLTKAGGAVADEPQRYYPTGLRTFGRIVPADDVQAEAQAQLLREIGCTRVHSVHDGGAYGEGLSLLLQRAQGGVSVVRADETDFGRRDQSRVVASIRRSAADCVALTGNVDAATAEIVRAVRGVNPQMKVVVGDSGSDNTFTAALGPDEGEVYVTFPVLDPRFLNDEGEEFGRVYEQRFGGPPEAVAVYGYEAMRAVLAAIDGAGARSNDKAAVLASFFALRDRTSGLGTYSITDTGDSTLRAYGAYRVEAGELAFDRVLGEDPSAAVAGAPAVDPNAAAVTP